MTHQQFASCIEACNQCAVACNRCATACLQDDKVKMMARCIALDVVCAEMRQLSAAAMALGSECAQECRRMSQMASTAS